MLHYLNAITENLASVFFRPRDVLGPNRSWLKEGGGRVMSHRNCDPPPEVLSPGWSIHLRISWFSGLSATSDRRTPLSGVGGPERLVSAYCLNSYRLARFAPLTRRPSPRRGLHSGEALYATRNFDTRRREGSLPLTEVCYPHAGFS